MTTDTGRRIPRMQARPPMIWGSNVMRSNLSMTRICSGFCRIAHSEAKARYLAQCRPKALNLARKQAFHTLALVNHLAAAVRFPINKAELFAKRFESAIGHNQNVHRHVAITDRVPRCTVCRKSRMKQECALFPKGETLMPIVNRMRQRFRLREVTVWMRDGDVGRFERETRRKLENGTHLRHRRSRCLSHAVLTQSQDCEP